jgi:hypothetical protein
VPHGLILDRDGSHVEPAQYSLAPKVLINRLRLSYPGRRLSLPSKTGFFPGAEYSGQTNFEIPSVGISVQEEMRLDREKASELAAGMPAPDIATPLEAAHHAAEAWAADGQIASLESATRQPPPDGSETVRLNTENTPPVRLTSPTVVPNRQNDDDSQE